MIRVNKAEEAEGLPWINTELHGIKNTSFRAGYVSNGWARKHKHSHGRTRKNTERRHILIWVGEWLQSPWTVFHGLLVFD
jgi:hypothetical protein